MKWATNGSWTVALASGFVLVGLGRLDAAEFPPKGVLSGHTNEVYALAFSPDGTLLASGSQDGTVRLWDVATSKQRVILRMSAQEKRHAYTIYGLALSPDGKTIVSGGNEAVIRIWEVATGKEQLQIKGDQFEGRAIAIAPDGKTLVSAGSFKTGRFWDPATGKLKGEFKSRSYAADKCLSFRDEGREIAVGFENSAIRIYESKTGVERRTIELTSRYMYSMALSKDGRRAVVGLDRGSVKEIDLETGKETAEAKSKLERVYAVTLAADRRVFAGGKSEEEGGAAIVLIDFDTNKVIDIYKNENDYICCLACSPDGKLLAAGGHDRMVRIWDIEKLVKAKK